MKNINRRIFPISIAVLGSNGFIGKEIYDVIPRPHNVVGITRENYQSFVGEEFDVFINANGNSKKFLAEKEPKFDFEASVKSVYQTIFDFKFKKYIYLSSLDVYQDSVYGINKSLSEVILLKFANKNGFELVNLRLGAVIGKKMKKGLLYDILNEKKIFIHPHSKLQFITNTEVANFIEQILSLPVYALLNLAGTTSIGLTEIEKITGKKALIGKNSKELQNYHYDVFNAKCIYPLKTSEQYIREVIK